MLWLKKSGVRRWIGPVLMYLFVDMEYFFAHGILKKIVRKPKKKDKR